MHLLNEKFDKVVCINLLRRTDKKDYMQEKFDKLGIEVEWFHAVPYGFAKDIVESLKPTEKDYPRFNTKHPNEFGAAISHYTVIKTALLQGAKNIFVFEDDVMFRKNFNTVFENSFNVLPENWDMFLLYTFMYKIQPQNKKVNSKWIGAYDGWSLMAYGMNQVAMTQYMLDQDSYFSIADRVSFMMQRPERLNIYSAIPTMCIPNQNLRSNIRGDNMNYVSTNTILNLGYSNENYE